MIPSINDQPFLCFMLIRFWLWESTLRRINPLSGWPTLKSYLRRLNLIYYPGLFNSFTVLAFSSAHFRLRTHWIAELCMRKRLSDVLNDCLFYFWSSLNTANRLFKRLFSAGQIYLHLYWKCLGEEQPCVCLI